MKNQELNLYIIDDDKLMAAGLRNYLNDRFGKIINVSTFTTGKSALEKINEHTDVVILDHHLEGENGNDILVAIKKINAATEVIMLSSNENIAIAIDSFRKGAKDVVIKGDKAWKKITSLVLHAINYPIRLLVDEFGVNKYLAIFLFVFVVMGGIVLGALKIINSQ